MVYRKEKAGMAGGGVLDCVRAWLTDGQLDTLKYPSNRLANETKSVSRAYLNNQIRRSEFAYIAVERDCL